MGKSDKGWAHIVCDRKNSPSYYRAIVAEAKSHGIHVLLQILDSVDNKNISLEQSNQRIKDYVDTFRETVDAYEIGNEVNMEPFPKMIEKMEYAAIYVSQPHHNRRSPWSCSGNSEPDTARRETAATLPSITSIAPCASALLTRNVDLWLVSMYHEGYPMGPVCRPTDDAPPNSLSRQEGRQVASSTTGSPRRTMCGGGARRTWRRRKTRPDFLRWHYAAAAGYERSILGGFWWGYIPEMASRNALWDSARQLFQEINR